eukprot:CAMPEP_0197353242 /NCGR_PEP_ID=MMETSP0893-20130614/38934_1 /TAXON_ID=44058 ORGANISM="Aureoumbra lagunensis, Strain CCMP1510" /NCGR_SAMPLE_ID=MMETSP0893 /ASSEMBLY_ACC=CAM_ASM_000539 /LENGTH=30 /DNA_ID= /DNA_START= /DNA_END= /DNA_ORIENTATION=
MAHRRFEAACGDQAWSGAASAASANPRKAL